MTNKIPGAEATSESKPSVSIITKNIKDQNGGNGNLVTAYGKTIKAKPDPDETTSLTSC